MVSLQRNKLNQAFLQGILMVCLVIGVISGPYFSPYGKLTMLDIGQGDAFILELPHRKGVFFIDAGARFDFNTGEANESVYMRIIKPYLDKEGITVIDGIFISHEDVDHMGSVDFMVENMHVKKIIISHFYQLGQKQRDLWNRHGTRIYHISQSRRLELAGQAFAVVSPHN
ncbi:MBL fold metallo-hydrolase [Virgibacillus halophilus]|uniref:MBL fold metallo-hydrolase n=1 Tax=Tigheibacillus halophilus TaxID=361280 RepID=A0ABU5CBR2_9BACI|nr:MBL fold metallo-hydrolase [Virgibacillus halophilus]